MVRKSNRIAFRKKDNDDEETTNERSTFNDVVSEHDKKNDYVDSKQCHKKQKVVVAAKEVTMISDTKKSSVVDTVAFNVGGKHYDVSRSLLNSYPDTMLARASSSIWTDEGKNAVKPIFIERDGDRFRWILDYMRDRSVTLPNSMSKEALILDFQYFGFDIDPQNIRLDIHLPDAAYQVSMLKTRQREMIKKHEDDRYLIIMRYRKMERHANRVKEREIELANTERDRLVNLANVKADKVLKHVDDRISDINKEETMERQYRYLVNQCFNHYVNTNELEWQLYYPNRTKIEFIRCGSYISHTSRNDFDNRRKPIYEENVIMKRIANIYGFSYIYAYYEEILIPDSDDDNDDDDSAESFSTASLTGEAIIYEVKFGILPRTTVPVV